MIKYIVISHVIFSILEYFLCKYLSVKRFDKVEAKRLEYNINHEAELTAAIKDAITERMHMLKKMSYEEWLEYNNKNILFKQNDIQYYFFIYEKSNHEKKFILRASYQKELVGYNFTVESEMVNHRFTILQMFPPYEHLPAELYEMDLNTDGFNNISYHWENPFVQQPVKKKSHFTKFYKDNITGIIGMGYSLENLNKTYGGHYFDFMSIYTTILVNILIFVIAIVVYFIGGESTYIKCIVMLTAMHACYIHQSSLTSSITNLTIEQNKLENIYSSVLGLSFLVGANVFIINNVKNTDSLKKELTFLFICSIIFLLLVLYKTDNYKSVDDLREIRIRCQLFFNYSILINLIIVVYFIKSMSTK
jgi:hypothetical protein